MALKEVSDSFVEARSELLTPFLSELSKALDEKQRTDFIRKHIITGDPVEIERNVYFDIRQRVADEFAIHPSSVVVVGSCKLGFTLKSKGPHQGPKRRYQAVTSASDVDMAVVSEHLFDEIWDAVFKTVYPRRDWPLNIGKQFTRDLFNGWIDPTKLPNTPKFKKAVRWSEFFNELTNLRLCKLRTINGRLYRTWGRLEAYQEHMIRDCQSEINKVRV